MRDRLQLKPKGPARLRVPLADGTLVTIPNSRVADASIDNMQRRVTRRRVLDVTITCDTPPEKVQEALAIIKYHELRNDRVLVLAPKRLRDNWTLYKANDKRNEQ